MQQECPLLTVLEVEGGEGKSVVHLEAERAAAKGVGCASEMPGLGSIRAGLGVMGSLRLGEVASQDGALPWASAARAGSAQGQELAGAHGVWRIEGMLLIMVSKARALKNLCGS